MTPLGNSVGVGLTVLWRREAYNIMFISAHGGYISALMDNISFTQRLLIVEAVVYRIAMMKCRQRRRRVQRHVLWLCLA